MVRLLPCLLALIAPAPAAGATPPPAWVKLHASKAERGPGRWEREFAKRAAILKDQAGSSPAAILGLLGLLPELQGEIATDRLRAMVHGVAEDKRRHPLVRSHARWIEANLQQAEGHRRSAERILEDDGFLLAWQLLGPFDNGGRRGETTVYAPETMPYEPNQSFVGKLPGEALLWRPVDYASIPRGGYVSLDDLLRPNEEVTGYATSWVLVPKATDAALHVGSGGPHQIWLDGQLVGEGTAYRPFHPLQDTYPIHLEAGWNRILVKTSALEGPWGFYARVSNAQGAPIEGLRARAEAPLTSQDRRPSTTKVRTHSVASLREALERRYETARPGRGRARAGADLLDFYSVVDPFDKDDHTTQTLARELEASFATAKTAALLAQHESDPNAAIAALRTAIDRARVEGETVRPLLGQLLLELAWTERSVGLEDRYIALIEDAAAVVPDDAVVELERIDQLSDRGYPWAALTWLRELAAQNPASSAIGTALALRLQEQGHGQEALKVLQTLESLAAGDSTVIAHELELLLDLGRADDAVARAEALAAASPGLPVAHATVAHLEESHGDLEAARGAWIRAIALAPQDADLHAEFGRLLARHGDPAAAVVSLQRSLDLKPQQPDVRDLLATLRADPGQDLFRRFAVDLAEIAERTVPASWAGKSSGLLHHAMAVRVLPNGLSERLDHRVIRILDDRGIRAEAVQAFTYDPAESLVEVRRARVRRQNGAIEDLGDVRVVSLASAGDRMYYDQRQVRVVFSGLRVGDTVEVAFLRRDIGARNMFEQYFGDIVPIQGIEPRLRVEYVLEAPRNKPIAWNRPDVEREASEDSDSVLYRFVATDVPAVKPENSMPGWTEIADYLHASTYHNWNDVGTWYWGLVHEQLVVDDDIRAAVATALKGLPAQADTRAKVDAIYEYVVRNTRYVGLEFGIHGYKPYRTTEVLSRGFGDCKDKASLLKVMLGEAGIESNLVLVRTRDQGQVPAEPASLAVFNHAITYVPSLDLYLDGTAEWSGPSELPSGDQGASVLIVKDGAGAEFRTIPIIPADRNIRDVEQTIRLASSGEAEIEHAFVVQGSSAAGLRVAFHSPEQRKERLTSAFGGIYPGVEIDEVAAPGIDSIQRPVRVEARLRAPKFAERPSGAEGAERPFGAEGAERPSRAEGASTEGDATRLRFRTLGRESTLTTEWAAQAEREHDLILDVPSIERHHLRIHLPKGYRIAHMPSGASIEAAIGSFKLTIVPTDDGASVESELVLRDYRVKPQDYGAFRAFLQSVDETLEQNFELEPAR